MACSCLPTWLGGGPSEKELKQQAAADKLVNLATKELEKKAKYKKARIRAWTGKEDKKQSAYNVGEKAYAQNPHYQDGTRLRETAAREAPFNGLAVMNDAEIEVVEVTGDFARVRTTLVPPGGPGPIEGWLRMRNLSRTKSDPEILNSDRLLIGLDGRSKTRTSEYIAPKAVTKPGSPPAGIPEEDAPGVTVQSV